MSAAGQQLLILALAAMLAAAGCQRGPAEVTLTLLSINDFHGALESESRDPESGRPLGGAAALAATLAREAASNPDGTLLLDAGDSFHGSPISNLSQGRATLELMNLIGFDATAIGNHEFQLGVPVLEERIAQARFPFLSANLVEKESDRSPAWVEPYQIFERRGLRVAVIGLSDLDLVETTLPRNVAGYEILDPGPVARRLVARLVPAEADLAVLLCHVGLWAVPGRPETDEGLNQLATSGAAAIVAGHTHGHFTAKPHGVPAVEAEAQGRYLGRIDLVVDANERRVISSEVKTVPVFADAVDPDPRVVDLVARYRAEVDRVMKEVIGEAAVAIDRRHGESLIGNLFTDAIRQQIEADVVLQNPGGLRGSFAAGPITLEDVYRIVPFDNTIVLVELSGHELVELLDQAVGTTDYLHISGLSYAVDASHAAGSRITFAPPFDLDAVYRVAVNEFMAQGGDGLTLLAGRPEARDTGIPLRGAFTDWIRQQTAAGREITAGIDGRIQLRG